jgi:Uma2 family endonuclease
MSTVIEPLRSSLEADAVPRLDARSNGTLMSPEEFDAVDDWDRGYRYELIKGVVIVTPAPGGGERAPNDRLAVWLWRSLESQKGIVLFDETLPEQYIPLPDGSRRRADRAIWVGLGRPPRLEDDVPAIVIEFCSNSRRDRRRDYEEKRRDYLGVGVREYWVIDRFQHSMTVFTHDTELKLSANETYRSPLLPGFELPLARLLEVADRYGQES